MYTVQAMRTGKPLMKLAIRKFSDLSDLANYLNKHLTSCPRGRDTSESWMEVYTDRLVEFPYSVCFPIPLFSLSSPIYTFLPMLQLFLCNDISMESPKDRVQTPLEQQSMWNFLRVVHSPRGWGNSVPLRPYLTLYLFSYVSVVIAYVILQ